MQERTCAGAAEHDAHDEPDREECDRARQHRERQRRGVRIERHHERQRHHDRIEQRSGNEAEGNTGHDDGCDREHGE
jgi:hypothetical protein